MAVLYRTYRPQKWSEVVGQDQVVGPLKDSIEAKRIAHAYLFSGSRGTGKTSVARIFAKSIDTNEEDVYEIDAASNRGIDNIRELREHVAVLPFSSTYKVYIVDEVHMLSKDAWNALLKTIEEPPRHVIFILATTEIEKVPDTIISRCQTFVFKKPSREIVRKQITNIAKKEGFDIDNGAGELIAILGDGSFRDSLGILEKIISSSPSSDHKKSPHKIAREDVEAMTGAPKALLVNDFIENILGKNCDGAISVIGKSEDQGISMSIFSVLILEKMRFILLLQHSISSKKSIEQKVSKDDFDFIEKEANKKVLTPAMLSEILSAVNAIPRSNIASLPLELACVRICL